MSDRITVQTSILILTLQVTFISVFFLSEMGVYLPVVRQSIVFLYLIFVPGFLLFQILLVNENITTESLFYIIGLSVSFIMFTGFVVDIVLNAIGVSNPFSKVCLFVVYNVVIFVLWIIYYFYVDGKIAISINIDNKLFLYVSFLIIILFLSIFGSYTAELYNINIFLLLLLLIISIIPVIVAFDFFPKTLYSLVIFVVAIALLYHWTLSTKFLYGADIHFEYYNSKMVLTHSFWNPSNPSNNYNAMLSIVILAPTFSILCGMRLTSVFKILYPVLYSLVPFCLYYLFKRQTNEIIAFYSCFFFISFRIFFTVMTQLARQQIAEFFLALILFLITSENKNFRKIILLIIFSFSLITSHYGTSYIFLIFLFFVYIIVKLVNNRNTTNSFVNFIYVFVFTTLTINWYLCMSTGHVFNTAVKLGKHIVSSVFGLYQPVGNSPLYWVTTKIPLVYRIERILHFVTIFSIVVGLFAVILSRLSPRLKKFLLSTLFNSSLDENFSTEYIVFSLAFFCGILVSIIIPRFTGKGSIGFTRFYQISLILLSPFCILGFLIVCGALSILLKNKKILTKKFKIVAVFFMIFLLFNSNFIAEILGCYSTDISISKNRILNSNDTLNKLCIFQTYVPEWDVFSAKWLFEYRHLPSIVLCDHYAKYTVLTSYGMMRNVAYIVTNRINSRCNKYEICYTKVKMQSYIYLRWINYRLGLMPVGGKSWWKTSEMDNFLAEIDKVYSNFGSVIYYKS